MPLRDGSKELPFAVLAVALPERIVAAASISTRTHAPPSVGNVLRDLVAGSTTQGQRRKLLIDAADKKASSDILDDLALSPIPAYKRSTQRLLARAFGDQLGNLVTVYRPGSALAKPTYRMGRHDAALSEAEARSAIEYAIKENNRKRGLLMPYTIIERSAHRPQFRSEWQRNP